MLIIHELKKAYIQRYEITSELRCHTDIICEMTGVDTKRRFSKRQLLENGEITKQRKIIYYKHTYSKIKCTFKNTRI